eukprot:407186-Pyramimonas_sp.AAC.1
MLWWSGDCRRLRTWLPDKLRDLYAPEARRTSLSKLATRPPANGLSRRFGHPVLEDGITIWAKSDKALPERVFSG